MQEDVPPVLQKAGAWSWRLIVVGIVVYAVAHLALKLELVVVPLLAAILLAALLDPLNKLFKKIGLGKPFAAVLTVLLALGVLVAAGTYVVTEVSSQYSLFVDQISKLVMQGQNWLTTGPLSSGSDSVSGPVTSLGDQLVDLLRSRQGEIAGSVAEAGRVAVELLTAGVLTIFLTIFILYDGPRIWSWLTGLISRNDRKRVDLIGAEMWRTVSGYVRGTFLVATFHGVIMGITLYLVGVPLVVPLTVIVFLGSFIPLVGVIVSGGLAVAVTLVSKDATAAVIVFTVLVVENQVESHVLQPFIVGKHVRLHPMAVALAIATGVLLAGLPGAFFGVPLAATLNAAVRVLRETGASKNISSNGSVLLKVKSKESGSLRIRSKNEGDQKVSTPNEGLNEGLSEGLNEGGAKEA